MAPGAHPGVEEYFILFLLDPVTIACKFLATKVEVLASSTVIGKITGTGKTTSFKFEVNVIDGKQQFISYENDKGEAVPTELKLMVNHLSAKGTIEYMAWTLTTELATELIN
ncbi:MAG TPA: hypothetical protein VGG08_01505 [Solirubrobacteraceae bacterium]|jgi:hypothetical protein